MSWIRAGLTITIFMVFDIMCIQHESEVLHSSESDIHSRIVGGRNASIEQHPYQVMIWYPSHPPPYHDATFCGGFIVSPRHILTAAHCINENVSRSDSAMRVGSSNGSKSGNARRPDMIVRAGSTWWPEGFHIPVAEAVTHPEYNQPQFNNDVAVLRTQWEIPFSDRIKPIALPWMSRPLQGGSTVVVSGWGRTSAQDSSTPDHLMSVELPVRSHAVCSLVYWMSLTDNEFCAGDLLMTQQATCFGDSGGAAVQDGMAVGIVSYGRACGGLFSPSVFTDLAAPSVRNFIRNETGI